MPLRFNSCPHCDQRIVFRIEPTDIDQTHYPAPIYIYHNVQSCGKTSTFFVDSLLRVSYKELEIKPGGITTLEINK